MQIVRTNQFKKDFKLCMKRGKDAGKLQKAVELLCSGADLPQKYRNHKLIGNWEGCWELLRVLSGQAAPQSASRKSAPALSQALDVLSVRLRPCSLHSLDFGSVLQRGLPG